MSWITATGSTAGTGPGTFSFTVAANTGTSARSGTLTVAGQSVTITQAGLACTYALEPAGRAFGPAGGAGSFEVSTQSGCAWTAAPAAAWLSISAGASGSGNGTVTYQVAANPDAAPRASSIAVGGASHDVTQSGQAGCAVALDRDRDAFPVSGGSGRVEITASSGCAWAASSDAAWVRITDPAGGSGTGSYRLQYVVDANAGASSRVGTLTIGGKTVTITQAGTASCSYSVAPVDVRACMAEGFSRSIAVTTDDGCPWTASTSAPWIAISAGSSGTGSGTIVYTLGYNFDAARQAIIEVRWPAPTAGQNVRVAQAGCTYGVSKTSIDVPAAGGDFSFDVISSSTDTSCGGPLQDGCMWSAASSASWVTVTSWMPRWGDDRVSFSVAANGTGSMRTATITVRDKVVTIRQAGS